MCKQSVQNCSAWPTPKYEKCQLYQKLQKHWRINLTTRLTTHKPKQKKYRCTEIVDKRGSPNPRVNAKQKIKNEDGVRMPNP